MTIAVLAGLAAVMSMIAVMVSASAPAGADAAGTNTLAGLEKSLVILQTKWSGEILVPASATSDGVAFWTKPLSAFSTCTGWFASKTGQIVTAGHCVDPAQGRKILIQSFLQDANATGLTQTALVNWTVDGGTTGSPVVANVQAIQPPGVEGSVITSLTTVQVVDFKPTDNGDLALLQLPDATKETPPLIVGNAAPQVGDPVTSIGFPGDVRDIGDQSQLARASFKSGTVSSLQVTPQGVTMIEVSDPLSGGMSGGPTVDKNGAVMGINDMTLTGDANFNFVTNTPDLRSFLLSHGVVLAQPAAPKSGIDVLWYAIGGGVALLLALSASVLAVILRRKRRRAAAEDDASAQTVPAQVPAPPTSAGAIVPTPIAANGYPSVPVNDGQAATVPSYPTDPATRNGVPVGNSAA
ncbi:MAG: trypsin-like peptidase domain-containing protein [Mycobacterium sp.]|nr:trypsin-like peptidase domain-containing protein [Mycobacterium sp.]